jgi:BirA family biotin operon repressor/biotin-[acetyl-CoA-carboxylase] ligase
MIKTIHIKETDSTNDWLRTYKSEEGEEITVVTADFQSAGRGCGTNQWESEAGKNLMFSILFHPQVLAKDQFILSMANALALKDTLDHYTDGISIKWPNDIYWNDRKICGTLIETSLQGKEIKDCIIGTGINVNQRVFNSDAPNPVSLVQIIGHETDLQEVQERIVARWVYYHNKVEKGDWHSIRSDYRSALYRRGEPHDYRYPDGSMERMTLVDVTDDGHLLLLCGRELLSFAFKEIQFVI